MQARFHKHYLELPSDFTVHFISSESVDSNLCDGINGIMTAPAVGFYLETSPVDSTLPSILSISAPDVGFVFNLETLGTNEAFASVLERLMKANHIAKVGLRGTEDLERLAASYPLLAGCRTAEFLIEIEERVAERNLEDVMTPPNTEPSRRSPRSPRTIHSSLDDAKSINRFAEKYLGKSLQMTMSISDWNQRPLSERQLCYAALNALVPVQTYMLTLALCQPITSS